MIIPKELDQVDLKLLHILQQDGRLDVSRMSRQVYKSDNAIRERLRKLLSNGYIKRFTALLDRNLLGRPLLMIVLIKLNNHAADSLSGFAAAMTQYPEVQQCLHLSGEYDFILQLTLTDTLEYEHFLATKLCTLPMVEKVNTSLVLRECKMEPALPLPLA